MTDTALTLRPANSGSLSEVLLPEEREAPAAAGDGEIEARGTVRDSRTAAIGGGESETMIERWREVMIEERERGYFTEREREECGIGAGRESVCGVVWWVFVWSLVKMEWMTREGEKEIRG